MTDIKPFVLDFNLQSGLCESGKVQPMRRHVSHLAGQFADRDAAERLAGGEDPLLYEFYGLDLPENAGVLQFGTTVLYPGRVGDEYNMTKGHFHTVLDTSEIYYTLSGQGMMLMETPEGEVDCRELKPGDALYVPGRRAHRSINTGSAPLVLFFVYRADAGHDYGTIEDKGFRKILVEKDGSPVLLDNPRWQNS